MPGNTVYLAVYNVQDRDISTSAAAADATFDKDSWSMLKLTSALSRALAKYHRDRRRQEEWEREEESNWVDPYAYEYEQLPFMFGLPGIDQNNTNIGLVTFTLASFEDNNGNFMFANGIKEKEFPQEIILEGQVFKRASLSSREGMIFATYYWQPQ